MEEVDEGAALEAGQEGEVGPEVTGKEPVGAATDVLEAAGAFGVGFDGGAEEAVPQGRGVVGAIEAGDVAVADVADELLVVVDACARDGEEGLGVDGGEEGDVAGSGKTQGEVVLSGTVGGVSDEVGQEVFGADEGGLEGGDEAADAAALDG